MDSNIESSDSNIESSEVVNVILDSSNIQKDCCLMNEICNNRITINLQCQEIGKLITERDDYKIRYENLLLSINKNG